MYRFAGAISRVSWGDVGPAAHAEGDGHGGENHEAQWPHRHHPLPGSSSQVVPIRPPEGGGLRGPPVDALGNRGEVAVSPLSRNRRSPTQGARRPPAYIRRPL